MPPRARNVDDSRSETSSTVTNQKEKALLGPHTTSSSGVSKSRRTAANAHGAGGSSNKAAAANSGAAAAATATSSSAAPVGTEKDGNLPKTDWNTVPTSILRTYRVAHRLSVPSTLNHPHADLTYNSSSVALRAPSAVQARRRLREQKHRRRQSNLQRQTNGTTSGKNGGGGGGGSKGTERGGKDGVVATSSSSGGNETAVPDHTSEEQASTSSGSAAAASTSTTFLGPREPPSHLANSVRKHFNAQQLSEADTVARFIYVVQQNGRTVRTEGSGGDGTGYWMGSHGRQVRRVDGPGGEVGFRLRFRP
ncbi:hypothetical protein LTS17_002918 [Exophiala oligosperma]